MTTAALREVTEVNPEGGVVVGDDGSRCAAVAVAAAADEAVRRAARLHVIRAWSVTTGVRPADCPPGIVPSFLEFEAATLASEKRRVAELVGDRAVDVEVHAVHATAVKALLHASEHADLLVVGTRGLGGFKNLILGSVAEQCIRHAACSVLVVRG
jgi:nucleotide-binding universal stress UspA family protein